MDDFIFYDGTTLNCPRHFRREKAHAILLAIFGGWAGLHKIYLGRTVQGVLYFLFCWTLLPAIFGIVEGICYLFMSDWTFNYKYNYSLIKDFRSETSYYLRRDKTSAAIFALLLGSFGVHKFYLGKTIRGILYLLFCWTFIPAVIGFIEGICYLCMSDESFNGKYN